MSDTVWDNCVSSLQSELPPQQFNTWIRPLKFAGDDESAIVLVAPNRFVKDWVNDKYRDRIQELFAQCQHEGGDVFKKVVVKVAAQRKPMFQSSLSPTSEQPRKNRSSNSDDAPVTCALNLSHANSNIELGIVQSNAASDDRTPQSARSDPESINIPLERASESFNRQSPADFFKTDSVLQCQEAPTASQVEVSAPPSKSFSAVHGSESSPSRLDGLTSLDSGSDFGRVSNQSFDRGDLNLGYGDNTADEAVPYGDGNDSADGYIDLRNPSQKMSARPPERGNVTVVEDEGRFDIDEGFYQVNAFGDHHDGVVSNVTNPYSLYGASTKEEARSVPDLQSDRPQNPDVSRQNQYFGDAGYGAGGNGFAGGYKKNAERPVIDVGLQHKSNLNNSFTFETFVVGKSNQLGLAAASQVAENPGGSYNPLFVYGGVGLGKTHLMHSVGNALMQTKQNAKVIYLHSERFVADMVKALQLNAINDFKRFYRSVDALLIDDIQFFARKERSQEEFFHTFNALLEGGQQIILTCDRYPKEINGLEERLKSRFGWGLTVAIEPPELETRVAILKSKAESAAMHLPNDAAFFIAQRIRSNVRELEGALKRVIANAHFTSREISIELVREALKDLLALQDRLVSIDNIQRVVAEYYKIKVSDLHSKRRSRSVARPRQVAMYLAKDLTHHSLPEIGEAFGGRDHTTVLHACRKVTDLTESDTDIREDIKNLLRTLTT